MKFVLDTCIVSEAVRSHPHPSVLSWLAEQDESDLFLCHLSVSHVTPCISTIRGGDTPDEWPLIVTLLAQ